MIKSVYKQVRGFAFTYPCPRKLREVMKISLVEREMPHTIKDIWSEYHKPRSENIAATLSKTEYETLRKKFSLLTFLNISALESPMYLVPIKRKGGHFMLLGQNQAKTFIYTFLEDFKKLGTNATPYFVLTMFDELLFHKELALVRGDIIDFKLNKQEAQSVFDITKRFMLDPDLYFNFVYKFNHQPQEFNYAKFTDHFSIQSS